MTQNICSLFFHNSITKRNDCDSKTTVTKLGLREGHDVLDSAFTSSSTTSSQYNYLYFRSSEYSGTTYDPYLQVTYSQTIDAQPTTQTVTYAYDHAMRRVAKKSETETTYYPSHEYALTGDTSTVYISGASGLAASIENNLLSSIHTDHLGSTSVVTDEQGIMNELLDYHAYGTERLSWSSEESGEAQAQRTYIGEYADEESGLSYLNARYYDAGRGQFLSIDPVFLSLGSNIDKHDSFLLYDPQSQNGYLYSRGNPIILKDGDGEFWDTVIDVGSVAIDTGRAFYYEGLSLSRLVQGDLSGAAAYADQSLRAQRDILIDVTSTVLPFVAAPVVKVGANAAETAIKNGWKVGESITNNTAKGNIPSWSTVRQRYWKNEAVNPTTSQIYETSIENLDRMKRGLAPQGVDPGAGKWSSVELHHNPPQREGGLFNVKQMWPSEHAAVDPYRKIK